MRAIALMCHAPIVIPAIGRARAADCATTTAAMRRVARAVVDTGPEVLVVLSPHTPRDRHRWGLVDGEQLEGTFARFGCPEVGLALPNAAPAVRDALGDLPLAPVAAQPLDHGALVPLWFLVEAGWSGPTAVLGVPWNNRDAGAIGERLRSRVPWGLVASGDMSHRLQPGAPAGFDPRAHTFDEGFVRSLREGDLLGAVSVARELRERAAEDVVDTTEVLLGALGPTVPNDPVLAYEGPFGVGYCEALFVPAVAHA
ncbi:MAG: hypothetical protein H6736_04720 [Alphaproteobacteria bacterium]|nr:hypothetical protein [Alphaproteobacteria bacterium]MCB9691100.1 hypothetical protein [Alphaproteobacteria bacterium]